MSSLTPDDLVGTGHKIRKNIVSLDGDISQPELEKRLVRIFAPYFNAGTLSREVVEDILVIRDLRMIVQTLKICSGSDRSINKFTFATLLLKYLYSEPIATKLANYTDKNQSYIDIEIIHCTRQYPKLDKTLQPPENLNPEQDDAPIEEISQDIEKKVEIKKNVPLSSRTSSRNIPKHPVTSNASQRETLPGTLKPVTIDDGFAYLNVIKRFNSVIFELSEKITELERSVSVLMARLVEAEKYFSQKI